MNCVIFGTSSFINDIDVNAIINNPDNYTIGINRFGLKYNVDTTFQFDKYFKTKALTHCLPFSTQIPSSEVQDVVLRYAPIATDEPLDKLNYTGEYGEILELGFKYFTVSCVVNYAVLEEVFSNVYLVGIDHIESCNSFIDFDGTKSSVIDITPEAHRGVKQFILNCSKIKPVYQTNPKVANAWQIPYRDIQYLL